MERLTKRNGNSVTVKGWRISYRAVEEPRQYTQNIIARLAAYEDSGLTPEEVAELAKIVRCKDCVHYDMDVCLKIYSDGNISKDAWQERKPNDFCSFGEKKGER